MRFFARILPMLALTIVGLLLAACVATMPMAPAAAPMKPAPQPEPGKVTVVDVRVRAAPLEGGNTAGFMTVLNGLDKSVRLTGVTGDVAAAIELHETINDNGIMKMEPRPDGFAIPAGGSLELAPGGKHVMIMGLVKPLAAGDTVDLTLNFDNGEQIALKVPVLDVAATMPGMNDSGGMNMHEEDSDGAAMPMNMPEGTAMPEGEHHEGEMGDHGHMTMTVSAEVKAAYEALPIDALHDMDEVLAAGTISPEFITTVDELQTGLAAITWPEPIAAQIEPIRAALTELKVALEADDAATAAPLAATVHGLIHALEFTVEPAQ